MRLPPRLLGACLALVVTSCSTDPKKAIVGKWAPVESGDVESVEFGADGSLKVKLRGIDPIAEGTYKFVDDQTIQADVLQGIRSALKLPGKLSVPFWLMTTKAKFNASGNELRIAEDKKEHVYRLVQ
jgi:hypothetical protein